MNVWVTDSIRGFVEELARLTQDLELKWRLDYKGAIRRTCCEQECTERCPITEVCWDVAGLSCGLTDAKTAGGKIGLDQSEATSIVLAADKLSLRDPELRLMLLEACGLPID